MNKLTISSPSVALLVFGILIFLLPSSAVAQSDWVTVRNAEFSFRFIHPSDWRVATPRGQNVRYSIDVPDGEPFGNCNIVVRRVPELKDYTQRELNDDLKSAYTENDWRDLMGDKFPDMRVIEARTTRVDNRPAQYAVLEYSYEAVTVKVFGRSMNIFTASPGLIWHFSCMAGGNSWRRAHQSYAHWETAFVRILSSLVFEE